jgi:hypothetical protein
MIFAHALIILPALLPLKIPFHRGFYLPPLLLQLSLIMRLAGDLWPQQTLRQWGGLLNAVAILAFLLIVMITIVYNRIRPSSAANVGSAKGVD